MVDQKIIDEARARGIVPGKKIACAYGRGEGTVAQYEEWYMVGKNLWCGKDYDGCNLMAYSSMNDRWATVITPAPQAAAEGLVEGDACECGPAMRAAIIELADDLELKATSYSEGIIAYYDGKVYDCSRTCTIGEKVKNWHTPEAFIAKMRVEAAKPKPIRIGDNEVKFNTGSIKVGCTTIDNATVRAIAANLKDQ